jgi:hypothetical protein
MKKITLKCHELDVRIKSILRLPRLVPELDARVTQGPDPETFLSFKVQDIFAKKI